MYEEASVDDLVQIFAETVVRYKQQPVYIQTVRANKRLKVLQLDTMSVLDDIPVSDANFDFAPVPLGFCNHKENAFYLSREPRRQYKQGLNPKNLNVYQILPVPRDVVQEIAMCKGRSLSHCIQGLYPDLKQAIKCVLEKDYKSIAFDRRWAIDENLSLYFKRNKVGVIDADDHKPTFTRPFTYLKEVFNARISSTTN